jgi:hypothetical protein
MTQSRRTNLEAIIASSGPPPAVIGLLSGLAVIVGCDGFCKHIEK